LSPSTRSGPDRTRPGHADALRHGLELRAVTALPGGDHDRQRLLPLLAGQMGLGRQAAPRAAQPVIVGLSGDAARRLGLQIPLFRAPAAC
jgi:hypothetical protein